MFKLSQKTFIEVKIMKDEKYLSSLELRFVGCAEDPFTDAIRRHMDLHEGVTFFDLLKFLYQSSLGPFHLFEMMDEAQLGNWIRKNLEESKPSDEPMIEELYGKKWIRVNFGPYKKAFGSDHKRIYEAFIKANSIKHGQLKEYRTLLKKLVDAIEGAKIKPITEEPRIQLVVENFLKEYEEKDYPPIHHSEIYMLKNNCEYLVLPYSSLEEIQCIR